jgi:hypothetical protein
VKVFKIGHFNDEVAYENLLNPFLINSGEALGSTSSKRYIQPTGLSLESLRIVVRRLPPI